MSNILRKKSPESEQLRALVCIQLISLNEKFDTDTALGRAMLKIILIFAELEREQTGERTSATMAHRAAQGLWNGGRVIGYDPDPESSGGLRVNDEFAEVVRLSFDVCIEEGSASAAMRYLNEKGYRMPVYESRRGRRQGGGLFTKQGVIRMLTNPIYIGELRWKGEISQGQHEPLITRDTFEKVQKIIDKNRRYKGNRRKPRRHVFILQGLVRCSACGSMMTPAWGTNGSGKPYHYYQCTKRQHEGKEGCSARSVPAEALEKLILERLKELSTDENEVKKIVDEANSKQSDLLRKLARDQRQLNRQHQVVMNKLDSLVAAVEDGGPKAFKRISERMAQLEKERSEIEERLSSIKIEACRVKVETLSAETMAETFKSFGQIVSVATPERLKDLVPLVVEVIEWYEDPQDPGSGHYKIAYFEQPRLNIPKENPTEQSGSICSAGSIDWLPE